MIKEYLCTGLITCYVFQRNNTQSPRRSIQLQANWSILHLGVGDTEHALYEAILLCGLENRHIEFTILLYPLGIPSRPVLVAHLLQGREGGDKT